MINSLNGLDPFEYFTFARDFQPLKASHCHKLKPLPAKLNSLKYSFVINIVNDWNNLPLDTTEADTLNIFNVRLRCHLPRFGAQFFPITDISPSK